MLYNCLSWYKFVNTHLYHSRQLYNIHIFHDNFSIFNRTGSVYVCIRKLTEYSEARVHIAMGTGFIIPVPSKYGKLAKNIRGYAYIFYSVCRSLVPHSPSSTTLGLIADHFAGRGKAIGPVYVCL